jgi:hypothetical protein
MSRKREEAGMMLAIFLSLAMIGLTLFLSLLDAFFGNLREARAVLRQAQEAQAAQARGDREAEFLERLYRIRTDGKGEEAHGHAGSTERDGEESGGAGAGVPGD